MTAEGLEVPAQAFLEAACRSGRVRRGPGGVKSEIPRDTLIRPIEGGIVVDTPMVGTELHAAGKWNYEVSVDSVRLMNACEQIEKLGAKREPAAVVTIGAAPGQFWIRYRTTKLSIPAIRVTEIGIG